MAETAKGAGWEGRDTHHARLTGVSFRCMGDRGASDETWPKRIAQARVGGRLASAMPGGSGEASHRRLVSPCRRLWRMA